MKRIVPNMNDRELDDLFREAAARYSPAHKDDTWVKLQEKLDAPPRRSRLRRRKWKYLLLFLLAIPGLFTWQFLRIRSEINLPQQPSTHSVSTETDDLNTDLKTHGHSLPKTIPGKAHHDNRLSNTGSISYRKRSPGTAQVSPAAWQASGKQAVAKYPVMVSQGLITSLAVIEKLPVRVSGIVKAASPDQKIPGVPGSEPDDSISFSKNDPAKNMNMEFMKDAKQNLTSAEINHWSFGLTIGPDWSSASANGWKTGIGGGIKLTYRLNRKWAFSTGALLDKKLYDAHTDDYNPPDDAWRNYNVKNIVARCSVLDVPLNVEYALWNNDKRRISLGAGVSSFWMLEEKYIYKYKTNAGVWDQWDKELYHQNRHLFSIINLSAGYERTWQHFSVEAAPYLKIPVTGIGYGRVRLYSAGIHITLNYGLK